MVDIQVFVAPVFAGVFWDVLVGKVEHVLIFHETICLWKKSTTFTR